MDTLVNFGSAVKALDETPSGWRIGGYLVVFGSHDVSALKDKFTAHTDYDIEDGERTTIYYNHGLDGTLKRTKLGSGQLFIKEAGVWFEGQLKKRDDYLQQHVERIAQGVKDGVFGLSSGVPAHLVERQRVAGGHEVTLWPLGKDCSLTPTPAEPLTSCVSLKSLVQTLPQNLSTPIDLPQIAANLRHSITGLETFLATLHDSYQYPPSSTPTPQQQQQALQNYLQTQTTLSGLNPKLR